MQSWLFTKSDQSIYVVRDEGFALTIHGPGLGRQRHSFDSERELEQYQMTVAERCAATGWILYGADQQRRVGERRAARRGTPDRRMHV